MAKITSIIVVILLILIVIIIRTLLIGFAEPYLPSVRSLGLDHESEAMEFGGQPGSSSVVSFPVLGLGWFLARLRVQGLGV